MRSLEDLVQCDADYPTDSASFVSYEMVAVYLRAGEVGEQIQQRKCAKLKTSR